ncbi:RNA polymerase sigma factor [Sphingobacterium sp. 1.A.5]|jgi:DNA-directed RNA polymerase specialized sigma24 family protein|uniref:RNA polymerase sigma factor n=1 Tax=Sphingobacterium sp. 1.A.5 TaxID=2044604 RepID=UPI000C0BE52A|nr:sigma factor [Sphingobacterium sp. 1.A.5]
MNYKLKSDIEIWQACKQDDVNAYNELFDRYAKILYRQAVSYVKSETAAETLVMSLLLQIWENRNNSDLGIGKNVRAYLMLSMRNQIIDYIQNHISGFKVIDFSEENIKIESNRTDYRVNEVGMENFYKWLYS